MISAQLRLEEMDPVHFRNLARVMYPPPGGDPAPQIWGPLAHLFQLSAPDPEEHTALSPQSPAVILFQEGHALRVLALGGGTLPMAELSSITPQTIKAYRHSHQLPFVVALDVDALPRLWAEAQSHVRLDEDYVAQELALLRVFRDALGQSVYVDPPLLGTLPLPPYSVVQNTFNHLLPDGRSFIFYLVDQGHIWTSLIAAKKDGDIYLVTSHQAIARQVPFSSIRSDAKAVVQAVSDRIAPPHLALFLPLRVWHELIAGDRSAIARALANRQAILDPAPPWFLALVGAGAMAEAATRSIRLAGKLLTASRLTARFLPGGTKTAERMVQTLSNPLEALGLDPWELLRWSRDWMRRIELDRQLFDRNDQGPIN